MKCSHCNKKFNDLPDNAVYSMCDECYTSELGRRKFEQKCREGWDLWTKKYLQKKREKAASLQRLLNRIIGDLTIHREIRAHAKTVMKENGWRYTPSKNKP